MSINGEMLRVARQWNGFQQGQAAQKLGIEQPHLSRIENGLSDPTEEVLLKAEATYGVPRAFFTQSDPVLGAPVSVHPMWRRKADVTARDMDKIVAELNIRVFHLRRLLDAAEISPSLSIPKLDFDDYEDAQEIATIVRAHWHIPSGPIRDLTEIVEKAGILVVHSDMGGTSVSGVTFSAPGVPPMIVLNAHQPADRMRFTLAHELGHVVMHRFPSPTMEKEANEFASALLMPAKDIRPYFRGRKVDLALLASLKPEWKVAMQALLMRVSSLDLITKNQAQYLWKQISARKMRLREPPELDFPHEKPVLVDILLKLHRSDLGYRDDEIAALLRMKKERLQLLYYYFSDKIQSGKKPKLSIIR